MSASERLRTDSYAQAATFYLFYGLVYFGGAVAALTPDRKVTFFGFVPWWAFYVAGLVLICTLPLLVWRGAKWLTRFLTIAVAIKALTLCWKQGRLIQSGEGADPYTWFFIVVAIAAAALLFRASFGDRRPQQIVA